ncbi:uncharacterized protein LOC122044252 [Zingiber officinale]|uniref:uncharacterized protein LOC122044252 n=1 Tax=Zingiber officinale TaxID=94328 RepID=UPI001C4DD396|nr:uncharacterized protein LOC122044252 [Zingiber officinale]
MGEWFAGRNSETANAYGFFMPRGPEVSWASLVWRPEIMLKHRFILWLLAHGKLQTTNRMAYVENKTCMLCQCQDESNGHLFFECSITCTLWNKVRRWLEINHEVNSIEELFHILGHYYKGVSQRMKVRYLEISSMIYVLWEAHNRCLYEGIVPDIDRILRKVQINVYHLWIYVEIEVIHLAKAWAVQIIRMVQIVLKLISSANEFHRRINFIGERRRLYN